MAAFMKETSAARILHLRQMKRENKVKEKRKAGDMKLVATKIRHALKEPFVLMFTEVSHGISDANRR